MIQTQPASKNPSMPHPKPFFFLFGPKIGWLRVLQIGQGGKFLGPSFPSFPVVLETVYNRLEPWLQERNPSVRAERPRHGFQEAPPPPP